MTDDRRRSRSGGRSGSESRSRRAPVPDARPQEDVLLERAVAGVLLGTLLLMGGRHVYGLAVYVVGMLLSVGLWAAVKGIHGRTSFVRVGYLGLVVAAVLLVAVQLIPLPESLLLTLKPSLATRLPSWFGPDAETTWRTLSYFPAASSVSLGVAAAHACLLIAGVHLVRTEQDVRRLVRAFCCVVPAVALFALVQFFFSNGKFFWVYEYPSGMNRKSVCGPFSNPNHLGQFLALGIVPLCWLVSVARSEANTGKRPQSQWSAGSETSRTVVLWLAALAVTVLAGFLTLSRGGIAACLFTTLVGGVVFLRRDNTARQNLIVALFGAGLLVAVGFHGFDEIVGEFGSVAEGDWKTATAGRSEIYAAMLSGATENVLTGVGPGAHAAAYRTWMETYLHANFVYGESSWIQVLFEFGLPGLLLGLFAVGSGVVWCLSAMRAGDSARRDLGICLLAGIVVSAGQGLFDFIWYIPAVVAPALLLLVCARTLGGPSPTAEPVELPTGTPLPIGQRLPWAVTCGCVLAAGAVASTVLLPRVQANAAREEYERMIYVGHRGAAADIAEKNVEGVTQKADVLQRVVAADPTALSAHKTLADASLYRLDQHLRNGALGLSIDDLRETLRTFESPEEGKAWMDAILDDDAKTLLGDLRTHAEAAVALCPLSGRMYANLDVARHLSGEPERSSQLLGQAYRARPYDPTVLVGVAQMTMRTRSLEASVGWWRKAYLAGPRYRSEVIRIFAPLLAADRFLKIFPASQSEMLTLAQAYSDAGLPQRERATLALLARSYEANAAGQTRPEKDLLFAAINWQRAEQWAESIRCCDAITESDPNHFEARHKRALACLKLGRYGDAARDLAWCVKRRPDDAKLQKQLSGSISLARAGVVTEFE